MSSGWFIRFSIEVEWKSKRTDEPYRAEGAGIPMAKGQSEILDILEESRWTGLRGSDCRWNSSQWMDRGDALTWKGSSTRGCTLSNARYATECLDSLREPPPLTDRQIDAEFPRSHAQSAPPLFSFVGGKPPFGWSAPFRPQEVYHRHLAVTAPIQTQPGRKLL